MVFVVWNIDLVGQEGHGFDNTRGDTFNYETVHIVNICQPVLALFVRFDIIGTIFDELVRKMKDNVKKIQNMMALWEEPLFERKMRPSFPDDLEQTH